MASLLRSPKSANNWSNNDLAAFNIQVVNASIAVFFNTPELPPPTVSPVILNNLDKPDGPLEQDDRIFFEYMWWAEGPHSSEPFVNRLTQYILRILNYDDHNHLICQRWQIPFPMAGQWVDAETEGCLIGELKYICLVHAGKVSCQISSYVGLTELLSAKFDK